MLVPKPGAYGLQGTIRAAPTAVINVILHHRAFELAQSCWKGMRKYRQTCSKNCADRAMSGEISSLFCSPQIVLIMLLANRLL